MALDDGYEGTRALDNMTELLEQRSVFGIIGNVGTPTAQQTVPFAVKNRMLFFGAFTGASLLRKDPPDRYVFNYRASYQDETAKMVHYLLNVKRIDPRLDRGLRPARRVRRRGLRRRDEDAPEDPGRPTWICCG